MHLKILFDSVYLYEKYQITGRGLIALTDQSCHVEHTLNKVNHICVGGVGTVWLLWYIGVLMKPIKFLWCLSHW